MIKKILVLLLFGLGCGISCFSIDHLTISNIFSSNAVLQCEKPVIIWGECNPKNQVYVLLNGNLISAGRSDHHGRWELSLPSQNASFTPQELQVISNEDTIELHNILFGEVWLAAGQSNMEFPINKANGGDDFLNIEYDNIRVLQVPHQRGLMIETSFKSEELQWKTINPKTSAIAAFFAADLQKSLQRPIGIIQCTWGGTNCETWIPLSALKNNPLLRYKADSVSDAMIKKPAIEYERAVKVYDTWVYEQSRRRSAGDLPMETPKPGLSLYNPQSKNAPSSLYQNMIVPLLPLSIRGVLWYQGESNISNYEEYYSLFSTMISEWRKGFKQPALPFLFVQLPAYSKNFKDLRFEQTKVRDRIANAEMVCTIDCGEEFNGHPKDKAPIGKRMASLALEKVFQKNCLSRGPYPQSISIENDKIIVRYNFVGRGLMSITENTPVPGFEVSDTLGNFYNAEAEIISNNAIEIKNRCVDNICSVRYAYVNWPDPPLTIQNSEYLPAEPFIFILNQR